MLSAENTLILVFSEVSSTGLKTWLKFRDCNENFITAPAVTQAETAFGTNKQGYLA